MTKERKRFEQWWDAEDDIPNDGPYTPDTPIQFAWAGWQAALAQPEQEPVAYTNGTDVILAKYWTADYPPKGWEPLGYTTPPQRTWVGLTDEDDIDWEEGGNLKDLAKAIEAKLKEKNT